jgi:hypothetical protein
MLTGACSFDEDQSGSLFGPSFRVWEPKAQPLDATGSSASKPTVKPRAMQVCFFFGSFAPLERRLVGIADRRRVGLWRALVRFPGFSIASTSGGCVWAECDRSARLLRPRWRAQLGVDLPGF